MSRITEELRKWARQFRCVWVDPHSGDLTYITNEHACPPSLDAMRLEDYITAIADRIDAEHERLMQEQPFTIDMVPMTDERMAEHGWIRLPMDADGEPIHIGDEVTEHEDGHTFKVDGWFMCWDGEWWVFQRDAIQAPARRCTHYHAPTVEDVLREFTDAVLEWAGKSGTVAEVGTWSDVAADFTAKLQLREDA